MKFFFFALILSLSLCSCHKGKKHAKSIMESKKSLVNRWYGTNHFDRNSEPNETESLNKLDRDDSVEIDAGKMTTPSNQEAAPSDLQSMAPATGLEPREDPLEHQEPVSNPLIEVPSKWLEDLDEDL